MRALIIDDEPVARKVLREELEALPGFSIHIAGEAADGVEGLNAIEEQKPDLVFVDIQMPVMGGFEFLASLPTERNPVVIMVTAYDEHALRAFEAGALDYLLKPVSQERLLKTVERASRLLGDPAAAAQDLDRLRESARAAYPHQPVPVFSKIVGKSGGGFYLLNLSDILAFQADGDLTWIVTAKGRFQATQNLRAIESRLGGTSFRRIHRNALINVEHVHKLTMISSQRWLLTLDNGKEFVVSKRQARTVREVLHW